MKIVCIFVLGCGSLPLFATYCVTTTVSYHIFTPTGMIVGQYATTTCYETSGGSGGGETGGGGTGGTGGTGGSGGSGTEPSPAEVANDAEFVDCLTDILAFEGLREMSTTHKGTDLFADNGTLIRSPVDGKIQSFRDDVPRNYTEAAGGPLEGNYMTIIADGAYTSQGGTYEVIPNAAVSVVLNHLDPGFGLEFGLDHGANVTKGQVIGRADTTGKIVGLGAHLDVTILKGNGDYADLTKIADCP